MRMSSNGNIFRATGPLCGEFTGHRWIPCTKTSDAELWCFLWSMPWIKGWVNNRQTDDLRRHLAHYDVNVMLHRNAVKCQVKTAQYSRVELILRLCMIMIQIILLLDPKDREYNYFHISMWLVISNYCNTWFVGNHYFYKLNLIS